LAIYSQYLAAKIGGSLLANESDDNSEYRAGYQPDA
jgi:hypothetical protein